MNTQRRETLLTIIGV